MVGFSESALKQTEKTLQLKMISRNKRNNYIVDLEKEKKKRLKNINTFCESWTE